MSELSPAAQAVDDAYWKTINDKWNIYDRHRAKIAAALRAAADQVVPEMTAPWNSTFTPKISAVDVRAQLFAIAAELEA